MDNERELKHVSPAEPAPAAAASAVKVTVKAGGEFNIWWMAFYLGVIALFAVLGAFVGLFVARMKILDIEQAVSEYQQTISSSIYDGTSTGLLGELAQERRVLIPYDQIPPTFIAGLIAIEDKDFLNHHGVDLVGIARAFWVNLTSGQVRQGGSTISQQLIKNLFLSPEQTYGRKIKEAILALQLEAKYTKEEILGFYCNTIYFGHQRYGLEAAAKYYFDKTAKEMNLAEAATLAGIIRAPEYYTPVRHPERALERRNLVLERMADVGSIERELAEATKQEPLKLVNRRGEKQVGQFFVEEVRRYLVDKFGRERTLGGGLKVYTTVDVRLQEAAERALRDGLFELSMRQALRPATLNLAESGVDLEKYRHSDWEQPIVTGRYVHAVVLEPGKDSVVINIDGTRINLTAKQIPVRMLKRHERVDLSRHFRRGDVIPVRIDKLAREADENGRHAITGFLLTQEPTTEAALVAVEARTGKVLAMVGGFDFGSTQFNRAVQAKRQTGSAFKPFVVCAAFEQGAATLADTIFDEPTSFTEPGIPELYQPENYKKKYVGVTTVRDILENSRNIPTILLMLRTGTEQVIRVARQMGIKEKLPPYFSLALGSIEMRLIDLVGVYTAFPNMGTTVEPYLISRIDDADGQNLFEHQAVSHSAIQPTTAFLVTQALEGVVQRGTAAAAASLISKYGVPLGGKTGTTDDYTDAWFVGFSPQIVCAVWVGNDEKVTIGDDESGAVAALPIWVRFMDAALSIDRYRQINTYEIPNGIIAVQIDRRTGLLASEFTPVEAVITEYFIAGTEPTRFTSWEDDRNCYQPSWHLMEKRVTISLEGDPRVISRAAEAQSPGGE